MSLLIKTDDRELNLKSLTPEQEGMLFRRIIQTIYGFKADSVIASSPVKQVPKIPPVPVEKPQPQKAEPVDELGYKGFLLMECKHCGKVKAFCAKERINKYFCSDCGETTEFENTVVKLYLNCKCGNTSAYHTNINDDITDLNCIECGAPVSVKYNEKKKIYETLR